MLASTLGPNMAKVTVNADLNVDQSSEEKLTYGGTTVPLTETTESEKMEGAGRANAGGTAGTGSNVPSYSDRNGRSGAGSGNYEKTTETRNNGVDKTITKTQKAPGRGQQDERRAADRQVGPGRRGHRAQADGRHRRRHRHDRAATRSPPRSWRSPRPATPKAGPVPTTFLGPPSGSAWASPRCCSSSS